uniref:Ribosomal protein L14 n=1 Tax=Eukaryota sp. BB2 TaxID=1949062 RepID=A0A1X8VEW9_9EUKA|nr:ribosomal protein L14 [Eukaryota sp. BB2]AQL10437.1 ribosomal protein L14 [Eukaryota sp. BB2]
MIFVRSFFEVADNTGATGAKCIKVVRKRTQSNFCVGDFLIVAIQTAKPRKKVKKGEVRQAVLIRQKKKIVRPDGFILCFSNNSIVLINKQKNPLGTRIKGPVAQELRKNKYMKVISMAQAVI